MALKIFHHIFWVCRTFHSTIWHYVILPENSLKVRKKISHIERFQALWTNIYIKLFYQNVYFKLVMHEIKNWIVWFEEEHIRNGVNSVKYIFQIKFMSYSDWHKYLSSWTDIVKSFYERQCTFLNFSEISTLKLFLKTSSFRRRM